MFLHPNQLRFAAGGVNGIRAMQAIITRPDGVRDHLALRVEVAEGTDEAVVAEGLRAAVQGVCRVKVDEVGFGKVAADGALVADQREWT
jgi:hypothetical protein